MVVYNREGQHHDVIWHNEHYYFTSYTRVQFAHNTSVFSVQPNQHWNFEINTFINMTLESF